MKPLSKTSTETPIFTLTITAESVLAWGYRALWFLAGGIVFGMLDAIHQGIVK